MPTQTIQLRSGENLTADLINRACWYCKCFKRHALQRRVGLVLDLVQVIRQGKIQSTSKKENAQQEGSACVEAGTPPRGDFKTALQLGFLLVESGKISFAEVVSLLGKSSGAGGVA